MRSVRFAPVLAGLLVAASCSLGAVAQEGSGEPPVAAAINQMVTPETVRDTICTRGWTKSIRPPSSYTAKLKRLLLFWRGEPQENKALFQLDHRLALSLGGDPIAQENLHLLPWDKARAKDGVARYLQCQVCNGEMSLGEAQRLNWDGWHSLVGQVAGKCHRAS